MSKFRHYSDGELAFARRDIAETLANFAWDGGHDAYVDRKLEERDELLGELKRRTDEAEHIGKAHAVSEFSYAVRIAQDHSPKPEHFEWADGVPTFVDQKGRLWLLSAVLIGANVKPRS